MKISISATTFLTLAIAAPYLAAASSHHGQRKLPAGVTIQCGGAGGVDCQASPPVCMMDQECTVICAAAGACDGVTVMCPTSDSPCTIDCDVDGACAGVNMQCATSEPCNLNCNTANACTGTIDFPVTYPHNEKGGVVNCIAGSACTDVVFNGVDENFFAVSCQEPMACSNVTQNCGTTQACSLVCAAPNTCSDVTQDWYVSVNKQHRLSLSLTLSLTHTYLDLLQ
jgi:hypothetical protein